MSGLDVSKFSPTRSPAGSAEVVPLYDLKLPCSSKEGGHCKKTNNTSAGYGIAKLLYCKECRRIQKHMNNTLPVTHPRIVLQVTRESPLNSIGMRVIITE